MKRNDIFLFYSLEVFPIKREKYLVFPPCPQGGIFILPKLGATWDYLTAWLGQGTQPAQNSFFRLLVKKTNNQQDVFHQQRKTAPLVNKTKDELEIILRAL